MPKRIPKLDPDEIERRVQNVTEGENSILADIRDRDQPQLRSKPRVDRRQAKVVPIELLDVHPLNMRLQSALTEDSCKEEIATILQHGQSQPLEVIEFEGRFMVIDGSRRLFSMQVALKKEPGRSDLKEVRCIVHPEGSLTEIEILTKSWVGNNCRQDLSLWEDARYIYEHRKLDPSLTGEDIAAHYGRSTGWASLMVRLGDLDLLDLGLEPTEIPLVTARVARVLIQKEVTAGQIEEAIKSGRDRGLSDEGLIKFVCQQLEKKTVTQSQRTIKEKKTYGNLKVRWQRGPNRITIDIAAPKATIENSDFDTFFQEIKRELEKKQ